MRKTLLPALLAVAVPLLTERFSLQLPGFGHEASKTATILPQPLFILCARSAKPAVEQVVLLGPFSMAYAFWPLTASAHQPLGCNVPLTSV